MAELTASEALQLFATATGLVAQLSTIVPELVANVDTIKTALASSDASTVQAQIDQVHADVQALAAQLDALKG